MKALRLPLACLLCVLLGAPASLSAQADPPPMMGLRVATYNVGLLRALGSDHVPLVRERAGVAAAAISAYAAAEGPDILLLQEIWTPAQARPIETAMAERGYASFRPTQSSLIGLNSGLVLFVKAPLAVESWSFKTFRKTTFIDGMAKKGILRAVLAAPGGSRFALLGTHTIAVDTVDGVPKPGNQLKAMLAQMKEISEAAAELSEDGALPLLLLGDFNAGQGYVEDAYRILSDDPAFKDSFTAGGGTGLLATWDQENPLVKFGNYPNEPTARIDIAFLRDGGGKAWIVKEGSARRIMTERLEGLVLRPGKTGDAVPFPLSDHYGYQVDLGLAPGTAPAATKAAGTVPLEAIQAFRAEKDRLVFTVWNKGYTGKGSFRVVVGEGSVGWSASLVRVAMDEGKMVPQPLELSWSFTELGVSEMRPWTCANPLEGFLW